MKRFAFVVAAAVSMTVGVSLGCSTPEEFHLFSAFDAGAGTGGAPFATGGASPTGGTPGSGGRASTGGSIGSGGSVNVGTGGATIPGSGGSTTTGGASGTASGGMIGPGSGGGTASGGASGPGSGGASGAGSGGRATTGGASGTASGGASGTGSGGRNAGATCIESIQAAGYSSGTKACSACMDHGVSNETKCKALIDCLSPTYPTCTMNMNCFNDCLNKIGGDGVLATCVEGVISTCN